MKGGDRLPHWFPPDTAVYSPLKPSTYNCSLFLLEIYRQILNFTDDIIYLSPRKGILN
jgi:hypothetical protein